MNLNEKSTHRGLAGITALLVMWFTPEQAEAIAVLTIGIMGAIEVFRNEKV